MVRTQPERYELHLEDATHLDTNPHLGRVWHRIGTQPTLPAAGTNRRLTVFGSVEALGRGRLEVLQARQDSSGFARYLAAMDARHEATGRHIILILDNGPCHGSTATQTALAERAAWLEVISLARYSPHLNPKEHEWRILKRDHRGHLAATLRQLVDEVVAGLGQLGGEPGHDCRRGARVVARRPPQGANRTPARSPHRRQGPQAPCPPCRVFTCVYLARIIRGGGDTRRVGPAEGGQDDVRRAPGRDPTVARRARQSSAGGDAGYPGAAARRRG